MKKLKRKYTFDILENKRKFFYCWQERGLGRKGKGISQISEFITRIKHILYNKVWTTADEIAQRGYHGVFAFISFCKKENNWV